MVVNFLEQEALLIPKIHAEGQNNTFQGCNNMERETLNGVNIQNYSCSVTYIRKRSWVGDCSDLRMAHGSDDPSIKHFAENGTVGMGMTDHLAGATINPLGQLGKPMLSGEKIQGII